MFKGYWSIQGQRKRQCNMNTIQFIFKRRVVNKKLTR